MKKKEKLVRSAYLNAIESLSMIGRSHGLGEYYFVDMLKPKEFVLDLIVSTNVMHSNGNKKDTNVR